MKRKKEKKEKQKITNNQQDFSFEYLIYLSTPNLRNNIPNRAILRQ